MRIRFYVDPETGTPHIHNHDVDEEEVADVCRARVRIAWDAPDRAWQSGEPAAVDTCG
jgi:hypothetical protein